MDDDDIIQKWPLLAKYGLCQIKFSSNSHINYKRSYQKRAAEMMGTKHGRDMRCKNICGFGILKFSAIIFFLTNFFFMI